MAPNASNSNNLEQLALKGLMGSLYNGLQQNRSKIFPVILLSGGQTNKQTDIGDLAEVMSDV